MPIIMYVTLTMICQPPNVTSSTLETSGKFKVKSVGENPLAKIIIID
jgi:hypothetical protein